MSRAQLDYIVRNFFADSSSEFSKRVNDILDGNDNRFNLSIDKKWNGENTAGNPNKLPININVTEYGDLRDVYGLVHELTHALDIDNGDTSTRRVLGEVAPQCMERLLDEYLLKNCDSLGFDSNVLSKDIDTRRFTTFISRAKNVLDFNAKVGNREKDSRMALAQIYQAELMKNNPKQAMVKLVNFINCVRDDDFEGANIALGMSLDKENQLQRDNYVSKAVCEADNLLGKITEDKNRQDLINKINENLTKNKDYSLELEIQGIKYDIKVSVPNPEKGINIPSILLMPQNGNIQNTIVLESNNMESNDSKKIIEQAGKTGGYIANVLKDNPAPIVIPILPSEKDSPYFQQLSKECFELEKDDKYYRIDEQIVKIINEAKESIKNKYGLECDDKIFLNGYSSSGVFAQRFALLHPEIIETACIGGASGSIPVPDDRIDYPIGIKDYEELFGEKFDLEKYSKIKFTYFVGDLETINKSKTRYDEHGKPAPMHDMSYFDRSVPKNVGKEQRKLFGNEMFERASNTVEYLKSKGINIYHHIVKGRAHRNMQIDGVSYQGVNEQRDIIVDEQFKECCNIKRGIKNITR